MAAPPVYAKHFADFKGEDRNLNDLVTSPEYCKLAQNLELGDDISLQLRKGEQLVTGYIEGGLGDRGLMRYTYLNSTTGATQEELLSANVTLMYRLTTGTVTMQYAGVSSVVTYSLLPEADNHIWCTIIKDGVTALHFDCGNGLTGSSPDTKTLEDLRVAIAAVAGISITVTPRGTANGAQVGVGRDSNLVLNAGHTFSVGDPYASSGTLNRISYVSGNNIRWHYPYQSVTVSNGQVIGPCNLVNAAALPIQPTIDIKAAELSFKYSYLVPVWQGPGAFFSSSQFFSYSGQTNFSGVNMNNQFYIAGKYGTTYSGLYKYDGVSLYRAGLPAPTKASVAQTTGGSLTLLSRYRYLVTLQMKDAKGITYESPFETYSEVTLTGSNNKVTFNATPNLAGAFYAGDFSGQCNGAQSGAGTQTGLLLFSGHGLDVGQTVRFYDITSASVVERTLTAVTETTIVWASTTAVSVAANAIVTNGTKIRVWRTKAGGTTFYLEQELVSEAVIAVSSTIADTALGVAFSYPTLGRERDTPPRLTYLAVHQGCLVGTGDVNNPNTVYWSLPGDPEAFPAASNSTDVPSTQQGSLTAIASDNESMLAVFKDRAYYNIVGDLDTYAITVDAVAEGDIGCPSHHALTRVRGALLFPSNEGFRLIQSGKIIEGFNQRLLPEFRNNYYQQITGTAISTTNETKLVLRRAVAINDPESERYICFIPAESGTPGTSLYPNANSQWFVYDYAHDAWFSWTTGDRRVNAQYGMAIYQGEFYFQGADYPTFSLAYLYKRHNTFTDYDYASHVWALAADYKSRWEHFQEPETERIMDRLKAYRLDSTLSDTEIRVNVYRNWNTTSASQVQLSFAAATNPYSQIANLKPDKAEAFQVRIRNMDSTGVNILHKPMKVAGYTPRFKPTIKTEDTKR